MRSYGEIAIWYYAGSPFKPLVDSPPRVPVSGGDLVTNR